MWVVQPHSQETALPVKYDGQVAGASLTVLPANCPVEHPGVSLAECPFRRRRDVHGDTLSNESWNTRYHHPSIACSLPTDN